MCLFCVSTPFCHERDLLLPFTKVKSQIVNLQKGFVGKSHENTLVTDLAILAKKWSKIAPQKKIFSFGLCHFLTMDIGLDQLQHPTVHSGKASRGKVCGVAVGVGDI